MFFMQYRTKLFLNSGVYSCPLLQLFISILSMSDTKKQTILPSIANIFFVQTFTIYFLLIRDLPSFGLYMVLYNNILNQCGSDSDYCQFFAGGMTGVDFYIFLLFYQINMHRYLPNIFSFLKKIANYFDKNIHLNSSLFFYG